MKKYVDMSEQELAQEIINRVGKNIDVIFSSPYYDPVDFVCQKSVIIKYENFRMTSKVRIRVNQYQNELTKDSVEQYLSSFIDNVVADINYQLNKKRKVYLAGGWFNPVQDAELTKLEEIFDKRNDWIDLASPRRIFVCPPNASREVQDATYHGNLKHIREADFLVVNTRDKDLGTIMECGYATAFDKHIVYFCQGLPPNAKFNLMLSRSGKKVCTSFEQLEDYLDRCYESGQLLDEPYDKEIE